MDVKCFFCFTVLYWYQMYLSLYPLMSLLVVFRKMQSCVIDCASWRAYGRYQYLNLLCYPMG